MAGGAACRLDERGLVAEETFLVGIENAYERDLRKIETFTQEIDADEDVKSGCTELTKDFYPLNRINIRVEVAALQPSGGKILGQIFRSFFGQCGDKNSLTFLDPHSAKFNGLVDLIFERAECQDGV